MQFEISSTLMKMNSKTKTIQTIVCNTINKHACFMGLILGLTCVADTRLFCMSEEKQNYFG